MKHLRLSFALLSALFVLASCKTDSVNGPTTTINQDTLGVPQLSTPTNGATGADLNPTLTWKPVKRATSYRIQVSEKVDFSTLVYDTTWSVTAKEVPSLLSNKTYYWHVQAKDTTKTSAWSDTWSFTTAKSLVVDPAIGSTYTLEVDQLDSLGNFIRVDEIDDFTVSQKNLDYFGRHGVTLFSQVNGIDIMDSAIAVQYLPNGDVGLYFGFWQDLPFGTGGAYDRIVMDTVYADGSSQRVRDVVKVLAPETAVFGSTTIPVNVVSIAETSTYQSSGGSSSIYESTRIYRWAPSIGFFVNGEIKNGDNGKSSLKLVKFELK